MAILTIALAVGANTALFSVVRAVFLRPLGFPAEARLVEIRDCNQPLQRRLEHGGHRNTSFDSRGCISSSGALYQDFLDQSKSFEVLGATNFDSELVPLAGSGEPVLLRGYRVTRSFFEALGVQPILGRWFEGDGEVVLSYSLWKDRFGGAQEILGRNVLVRDATYRVAGVMPQDFRYPPETQIWLPHPFGTPAYLSEYSSHNLNLIGRLRRDVSIEAAQAEATALSARAAGIDPKFNAGWSAHVDGLVEEMTFENRRAFVILSTAVGIVLLIACANLSSLLLAGLEGRSVEMSIRVALGAGRKHLFRQVLAESLVLSLTGGALGLLLAFWGVDLLLPVIPASVPRTEDISVDLLVALFSLAISLGTGIAIAILPGLRAAGANLGATLRPGTGRTATRGGQTLRGALVAVQVAFAVVLLAAAGLLFNTLRRMAEEDLGFRPEHLLVANAPLSAARFRDPARRAAFSADLLRELRQQPITLAAGGGFPLPFTGDQQGRTGMVFEGRGELDLGVVQYRSVTPGFFSALSIPLLAGREFDEADRDGAATVCIVNRTLAHTAFQTEYPIGRRLRVDDSKPWLEVVGVAGDVRQLGKDQAPGPEVYVPWLQAPMTGRITIALRYLGSKADAADALRAAVRRVDSGEPLGETATMEALIARSSADRKFPLVLFSVFGALALGIAAVGIYGVVSHSVAARTQEMGIRLALGAGRAAVMALILRQAIVPVVIGLAAGLGVALSTTRYLASLLYGVRPNDPPTLAAASVVLLLVAVTASLGPSVRACRADPVEALREM
ncbi:MAG: ABC transporter permease [Bryobacteraceae bacterium]|jgi:putative ABC transport system permease protein